jgi:hypothetical protein
MEGGALVEGAVMRFRDSSGGVNFHRIERLDRPRTYAYDLHGFGPPFSLLVGPGFARWSFTPERSGTEVLWTYSFPLTSLLAYPLARPLIGVFMRKAMERCLAQLEAALGESQ